MSRAWLLLRFGAILVKTSSLFVTFFLNGFKWEKKVKSVSIIIPNTTCSSAKAKLCYLPRKINFWWYSNERSCNSIVFGLGPYNYHKMVFVDKYNSKLLKQRLKTQKHSVSVGLLCSGLPGLARC